LVFGIGIVVSLLYHSFIWSSFCRLLTLQQCYQVNFADPRPGGTLPASFADVVQEEILFLVYPELFVTQLLSPNIQEEYAIGDVIYLLI
jgi:hypothetical protein